MNGHVELACWYWAVSSDPVISMFPPWCPAFRCTSTESKGRDLIPGRGPELSPLILRSGVDQRHRLVVVVFEVPARHEEGGDPVSHRGPELLGRSRAHVAGGEHAGHRRLHRGARDEKPAGVAF